MVEDAIFTEGDIPYCPTYIQAVPSKIITYNEAKTSKDYDAYVCFYKHDVCFDGYCNSIWTHPYKNLNLLLKFKGIITPDFSTYLDFPEPVVRYNIFRQRAFGYWFGTLGKEVVNNVRWGKNNNWDFFYQGIDKYSTIAISTYSALNDNDEKEVFILGFDKMYEHLMPKRIFFYGKCPNEIKKKYEKIIEIFEFETELDRKKIEERAKYMSKGYSNLYSGTQGSKNTQISLYNTINSNISKISKKYKLNSNGKFGEKGKNCRVINCKNPTKEAVNFFGILSKGAKKVPTKNEKGTLAKFKDGTILTLRLITKTPNSPAVEINVKSKNSTKIKSQKIHFIKN